MPLFIPCLKDVCQEITVSGLRMIFCIADYVWQTSMLRSVAILLLPSLLYIHHL